MLNMNIRYQMTLRVIKIVNILRIFFQKHCNAFDVIYQEKAYLIQVSQQLLLLPLWHFAEDHFVSGLIMYAYICV